jgi:hypothetical protein
LVRADPWDEPALTFTFCDLLDHDSQQDYKIDYSIEQLTADLEKGGEPVGVSLEIKTHRYPQKVESYVTQSDIGLIIEYINQFDHDQSYTHGWLLQAKRLFPDNSSWSNAYTMDSQFNSFDSEQHNRMEKINKWARSEFVRYLLYCPKPTHLRSEIREGLSYYRNNSFKGQIFDYALGLQLRDDIKSPNPTTEAGVFVARPDVLQAKFKEIHQKIFRGTVPFSWFVLQHFFQEDGVRLDFSPSESNMNNPVVNGLVTGNPDILEQAPELHHVLRDSRYLRILPAKTLTIRVYHGIMDRPRHNNG